MLTIRPNPFRVMPGSASRVVWNAEVRLIAKIRSRSSGGNHRHHAVDRGGVEHVGIRLEHLAESGDSVRGWGESKMQHTAEIGSPPAVAGESGVDSLCESPPCLEREGEPCRQRRPHRFNFRLTMNAN